MENIQTTKEALLELFQEVNLNTKTYLSIEEAADYLDISKSCLHKKTSKREIPFYKPGGKKIYFKREELHQWIESGHLETAENVFETHQLSLQKEKGGLS